MPTAPTAGPPATVPTPRAAADPALAHRVRVAVALLARRLRRERAATEGLTASQLAALSTLDRHGVLTLGELASHEHVQPPSMTRIAGCLEDLGLASRTPDPRDGRQVLLAATP
ncbi:MAG: MarR family transcriptional regulator, partial [Frankia sp.]|nr:MarR family transcriptional regulator [Frankia sp.]